MDPDTALAGLRAALTAARDAANLPDDVVAAAAELAALREAADAAEALDAWVSHGGYLPREWAAVR